MRSLRAAFPARGGIGESVRGMQTMKPATLLLEEAAGIAADMAIDCGGIGDFGGIRVRNFQEANIFAQRFVDFALTRYDWAKATTFSDGRTGNHGYVVLVGQMFGPAKTFKEILV